jgi:hypothetical protein
MGAINAAAKTLEGRPSLMPTIAADGDRRSLEEKVWEAIPAGHKRLTEGERHILHTDPATGSTSLAALKTLSEDQLQGYLQEAIAKEAAEEAAKADAKSPATADGAMEAAKEQIPVVWAGKTALEGPGVVLSADGSQGVAWQPAAGGRMAVKMFDASPGLYASLDVTQRATVGFQTRTGDRELRRLDASETPADQAALYLKVFAALGDAALGAARVEVVEPAKVSLWAEKGFDPYAELKTAKRPAVLQKLKEGLEKIYEAKEVNDDWLAKHREDYKLALWCPDMQTAREQVKNLEMRRADRRTMPDSWPAPPAEKDGEGLKTKKNEDGIEVTSVVPPKVGTGPFALQASLRIQASPELETIKAKLLKFAADGLSLSEAWEQLPPEEHDLMVKKYPTFMPSFDEAAAAFDIWAEAVNGREHILGGVTYKWKLVDEADGEKLWMDITNSRPGSGEFEEDEVHPLTKTKGDEAPGEPMGWISMEEYKTPQGGDIAWDAVMDTDSVVASIAGSGFYKVGAYDRETGAGPLAEGSGGANFDLDFYVLDKGTHEKVGGPYATVEEARRELAGFHKKRSKEHFAPGGQADKDYETYVSKKKPGMVSFLVASLETLNAPLLGRNGLTREALDQFKAEQRLRFLALEKPELEHLVRSNSLWAGWKNLMAKKGAGIEAAVGAGLGLDLAIRADIFEQARFSQNILLPYAVSAFKAAGLNIEQDVSGGWYVWPCEPLPMLYMTPWWDGEEGKIGVQVSEFGDGDMLAFKTMEEASANPVDASNAMVEMAKSIMAHSKVIPGEEGAPRVDFQP